MVNYVIIIYCSGSMPVKSVSELESTESVSDKSSSVFPEAYSKIYLSCS